MNIVAVNAASRKKGVTTQLTERAMEGAASQGAATEMIFLADHNIRFCKNCLACYRDIESELAPCTIDDDMNAILKKVYDADGVLLSSPIHCGFVNGLMVTFFERMAWRVCRPTGQIAMLKGVPTPRTSKIRAMGSIVTAGGMPDRLRKLCDGTPWIKENGTLLLNGIWAGDIYAGARFEKQPKTDQDWQTLYFLRKLAPEQSQMAYDLGVKLAQTAKRSDLRPVPVIGNFTAALLRVIYYFRPLYKTVQDDK
jgi:NAD(P)H-dependent FMN reductase